MTLSDVDSLTLSGAVVTLTDPQTGDVLSLQGQAGSSGTLANGIAFSISGAVVTFSNAASPTAYEAALHLIQFNNTVVNPSTSDRTFSVQVDDGGATNNTGSATATVTVGGINHAPTVTVPGISAAVNEDGVLNLTGATATDLDNGDVLTATVGVGQGTLTSLATPGLLAQLTSATGNGTGLITITGSASAVDAVVTAGVAYAPAANFNGQDQLVLTASDNHGASDSKQVTITVNAVNDAPVAVITPVSYSATEQTSLSLKNNGLSISDVDAGSGSLTVTLSVGEGTLTVTAGTSGAAVSNSGTSSVTVTGTVAQINALLNTDGTSTVSYSDNTDTPSASTTLTLSVNDNGNTGGGALIGNDTATINIAAVNDAPVAVITPVSYSATEQTSLSLKNNGLSISDVDAGSGSLTVTLSVGEGTLTVTAGSSGAAVSNSGTSSVTVTGTVAQINALLNTDGTSTVSYSDNTDTPSPSTTLTLSVNDNGNTGGGALIGNDTATINIAAVNDAPAITGVSASASASENSSVTLVAPSALVADVDSAASDVLLATLKVTNGTLTPAGSVSGVTIVNGLDGSNGTLQFTGTQAAITQAIKTGVIYTPTANFVGPDQLKITVDDQGHNGSGGAQQATAIVDITVANDQAPVVTAGNTIGYIEQALAIAADNALGVSDADNAALAGATVTISSGFQNGDTLTINGTTSGDIVNGVNTIHYNYDSSTHRMSLSGERYGRPLPGRVASGCVCQHDQ